MFKGAKRRSSGRRFIGVERRKNRFRVKISIKGKKKWLGSFSDEEKAALAYDEAARKLGRPLNFPDNHKSGRSMFVRILVALQNFCVRKNNEKDYKSKWWKIQNDFRPIITRKSFSDH